MPDLIEQVRTFLSDAGIRSTSLMVAVSGGADSIALLHLLHNVSGEFDLQLRVAHYNHNLRGHSSDQDEDFVHDVAKSLSLPFFLGFGEVSAFAEREGLSIEMAAREMRHQFFTKTARAQQIRYIALAHHGDDQAELFLLRLLRGTVGEGLGGMEPITPSWCDPELFLIRPLLTADRRQILSYLELGKFEFREDESNQETKFLRNRIRGELLPLLQQEYQPAIFSVLRRQMEHLKAQSDFVRNAALDWLNRRSTPFTNLPIALQREVFHLNLLKLELQPSFELIEFLRLHPEETIIAGEGVGIRSAPGGEIIKIAPAVAFRMEQQQVRLNESQELQFHERQFKWRQIPIQPFKSVPGTEYFDAEQVGEIITLRFWQPGDQFHPIGNPASSKLQDLLTNLKLNTEEKRNVLVAVTADGRIFWAEPLRISELFKVTSRTRSLLEWQWTRHDPDH
ncbi:MAG: tRNA lysidine(34) synthetase TilS [Verrucomicrobiota bacterium]|nr:tRNA lysidine(34) synthetase TilS [Verrucomicrobiota bacterium]